MCSKDWNRAVALLICNGWQTKRSIPTMLDTARTGNSRQLFDHITGWFKIKHIVVQSAFVDAFIHLLFDMFIWMIKWTQSNTIVCTVHLFILFRFIQMKNLEPSSVSRQFATILLETALEEEKWELAKELVRFLRAIGMYTCLTIVDTSSCNLFTYRKIIFRSEWRWIAT